MTHPLGSEPKRYVARRRMLFSLTKEMRSLLMVEAERARIATNARYAAVSRWDRGRDTLHTVVNVGESCTAESRFPADEVYPLDSFPAVAALVREGRAYLDPEDVSSAALAAHHAFGSQAGVPVLVEGEPWGELWAARRRGDPPLSAADLDRLHLVASRLADGLAAELGRA